MEHLPIRRHMVLWPHVWMTKASSDPRFLRTLVLLDNILSKNLTISVEFINTNSLSNKLNYQFKKRHFPEYLKIFEIALQSHHFPPHYCCGQWQAVVLGWGPVQQLVSFRVVRGCPPGHSVHPWGIASLPRGRWCHHVPDLWLPESRAVQGLCTSVLCLAPGIKPETSAYKVMPFAPKPPAWPSPDS